MEVEGCHLLSPEDEDPLPMSASSLTLLTSAKAFSLKELHTVARRNLIASTQESIARQLSVCSEDALFRDEALFGKEALCGQQAVGLQLSLWPDDDLFPFDVAVGALSDQVHDTEEQNGGPRGNVDGTSPVVLLPGSSVTCIPDGAGSTDNAKADAVGLPADTEADRNSRKKLLVCKEPGCGRTFQWRAHLWYHQQTHGGGHRHVCNIADCGRSFVTAQQLQVHRRVHTGERPFGCEHCRATFTTAGNLRNHCRSKHTGERPFACTEEGCKKKFAELSSLKKHRLVHTGEKPFKCKYCGKCFSQSSCRSTHVRKFHCTDATKDPSSRCRFELQAAEPTEVLRSSPSGSALQGT